ncbi:putative ribonuclease H-like domain protein I [Vibrio virus VPMCC5]|nr:putative ribonuclease H-like domain protein I [Vibrio virus VPMCC5]
MRKCVADLEANGLLDDASIIWCAVFKDIQTKEVFKFHHGQPNWEENCIAFMNNCETLIMHNGIGYDFPLMKKLWDYDYQGRKVDTLLISRLHSPDRKRPRGMEGKAGPHSIEAWGYRLGRGKPEHEDWSQFSPEMLHRCSEDVEIQYLTMLELHKEGKANNWTDAYNLTFKLFEILQLQEEYGWLADRTYMERCVRQLTTWIDRIDRAVTPHLPMRLVIDESKVKGEYGYIKKPFLKSGKYSAAVQRWLDNAYPNCGDDGSVPNARIVAGCFSRVSFRTTNLDSGDEMKQFLLNAGWKPKNWNYKKDEYGKPTTERTSPKLDQHDPFEGVNGKVGRLCAKRIQVRHRRSNIEGWINSIRVDGRISGRVTGIAATGRMKHAGIVNVPGDEAFYGRQMRKCFTSKSGFKLVSADASSCQDRMLAQRAEVQEFTDMLLFGDKDKGTDGHSLAMSAVNKVLSALGLPLITRKKGKNFNFAWKFGASDNKLGAMCDSGKNVGEQIRDSLRETFPAQAALVDKLTNEWRSNAKKRMNQWNKYEYYNGWITGLDGRPIFIESEHQILVYMLQSDEAIYMSTVYCIAYKDLCKKYKWGEDFGIVCFYHDELTIEIKEEYAQEAAAIIEQAFTKASDYYKMNHCPQAGQAEIGNNWLEVH